MKKYCVSFLIILFFCVLGQAQKVSPEQAKQAILSSKSEEAKLDSIRKYGMKLYSFGYFDDAHYWYEKAVQIAEDGAYEDHLTDVYLGFGRTLMRRNEPDKAISYLLKSKNTWTSESDVSRAFLLNILTKVYISKNLLDSAIIYNIQADSLSFGDDMRNKAFVISTRSDIYDMQGLQELAFQNAEKAVEIIDQVGGTEVQKLVLLDAAKKLALKYDKIEKYGYYTRKYLELSSSRGKDNIFHRGTFQLERKTIPEQIRIVEQTANYYRDSYYQRGYILTLDKLLQLYVDAKEWSKAEVAMEELHPYMDLESYPKARLDFYERKLIVEKELEKYKDAVETSDLIRSLRDTLQNQAMREQSLDLEEKYESKAKDQEILILNKENELKALNLRRSNFTKWIFVSGALALLLFSIYLYKNIREKKKINLELEDKNSIIETNLVEKETLLKEIHHRVKNNLQIISSLLRLQSRTTEDAATKVALLDGQNRVQSMALIHQNLYKKDNLTGVEVQTYFGNLCENLLATYSLLRNKVKLELDIEPLLIDISTLIPMGLIVNELFTNSLKYAFEGIDNPIMGASLHQEKDLLILVVYDNGRGITDVHKSIIESGGRTDQSKDYGFGTRLLKSFAMKLDADIKIENEGGARYRLEIKNFLLR